MYEYVGLSFSLSSRLSLSLFLSVSLFLPILLADGGCAVRVRLAAYFAQLRRARERVLTWRATSSDAVFFALLLTISVFLTPFASVSLVCRISLLISRTLFSLEKAKLAFEQDSFLPECAVISGSSFPFPFLP